MVSPCEIKHECHAVSLVDKKNPENVPDQLVCSSCNIWLWKAPEVQLNINLLFARLVNPNIFLAFLASPNSLNNANESFSRSKSQDFFFKQPLCLWRREDQTFWTRSRTHSLSSFVVDDDVKGRVNNMVAWLWQKKKKERKKICKYFIYLLNDYFPLHQKNIWYHKHVLIISRIYVFCTLNSNISYNRFQ